MVGLKANTNPASVPTRVIKLTMNAKAEFEQSPDTDDCSWSISIDGKVRYKRSGFGDYFATLRDFRQFKMELFVLPLPLPGKKAPVPSDN